MSDQRPNRVHALTSLRFFAAFYVVLVHTYPIVIGQAYGASILHLVSFGYLSVSFFFLLSGYILAIVYLQTGSPIGRSSFYAARLARIYPLFLLTLIADTPDLIANRLKLYSLGRTLEMTAATLAFHLVMLQAWFAWLRGIDGPNWTLSVETIFYLAFPLIGSFFWKMKGTQLWITACALWVGGQAVVFIIAPHLGIATATANPLFHLWTFPIGILLARWQILQKEKYGESPKQQTSIAMVLLFSLLVLAGVFRWRSMIPFANLNAGLLTPVFAALIWAFSGVPSLPVRLLNAKWLVLLGEASFALYLIHLPVFHLFTHFHLEQVQALFPVYLGICIGLSVLSFYFVEIPSRRWILRRFATPSRESLEMSSNAQ